MTKDEIKASIELKQTEMPFAVIERTEPLPLEGRDIITIPGVRRCGKSSRMELAINGLLKRGVSRENILWIGFDDERFAQMKSDELDLILEAYREMYPETPLKDVRSRAEFGGSAASRVRRARASPSSCLSGACPDLIWRLALVKSSHMTIGVDHE